MTRLTVVVPTRDEEAVVGRCIALLLTEAQPGEMHVVVVANGTTDRTLEVAEQAAAGRGATIETVDLPGPSKIAAVREGIRRADGAVLVLDADLELSTAAARALA